MSEELNGSVEDAGSSVTDWKASLDESLRSDPSLADIKDVSGLAKSYIHAQKMVGRDKVAIPQEGATPDEWAAFYDRLGRPSQYEINKADIKLPENIQVNEATEKAMLDIFHQAGLTNAQANAIYNGYMQQLVGDVEGAGRAREEQQAEWHAQLQKDFGKAFDQQVDLAQRAAKEFGGEDFLKWLDQSGMGDNPMFVKMFAKIGKGMSESTADTGNGTSSFALTPEAARQEIARLQRDPTFMKQYSSTEIDGHNEAIAKMQSLFQFAYPDMDPQ